MTRIRIQPLLLCLLALGFLSQAGPPVFDPANQSPHFNDSRCGDCHGKALPEAAAPYGSLANLYNHLCCECHAELPKACTFHVEKPVTEEGLDWIPTSFPMREGAMNCLTCHDAKIQCTVSVDENQLFLRGNRSGDPLVFCYRCHSSEPFLGENERRK